jgi:Rps23 Pro-64 3,4-dihydroxylase Tpa1-like proline 4-hydroxylase
MEQSKDRPISEVLEEIAMELGRKPEEVAPFVSKLGDEWVTKFSHWCKLSKSSRTKIQLPALLEEQLDLRAQFFGKDLKRTAPEQVLMSQSCEKKKPKRAATFSVFNPAYSFESAINKLRNEFNSAEPFNHGFLHNFVDDAFLKSVKTEILAEEYVRKANDLYDFQQTRMDLKNNTEPNIQRLVSFLYSEQFREWISGITGVNDLNDTIDISAARYGTGSTLLCHDDELEGRRIAWILYLVPEDWDSDKDGGTLDLFDSDENFQPTGIANSYSPVWNSFAFFEVSPKSHHQVSEVLAVDKERVSISGWFHGPPIYKPPHYQEPIPEFITPNTTTTLETLKEWISPIYMKPQTWKQIRKSFTNECNVKLVNFLDEERYGDLMDEIDSHPWEFNSTPNRRHYLHLKPPVQKTQKKKVKKQKTTSKNSNNETPNLSLVEQLRQVFQSAAFLQFIQQVTGLEKILPGIFCQVRKFGPGSYTLTQDEASFDSLNKTFLDVIFTCPTNEIPVESGSQMVYLDSDEELLSIPCEVNALSIVLRDSGTMRFVKYANSTCKDFRYDYSLVWEVEAEEEEEGEEEGREDEGKNGKEEEE